MLAESVWDRATELADAAIDDLSIIPQPRFRVIQ
jgi:hypothetical protein